MFKTLCNNTVCFLWCNYWIGQFQHKSMLVWASLFRMFFTILMVCEQQANLVAGPRICGQVLAGFDAIECRHGQQVRLQRIMQLNVQTITFILGLYGTRWRL